MIRRSASICSPRKTIQVTPVTGQATWMSQSGRSASSEVRFQAKRVNSMPAETKTQRTRARRAGRAAARRASPRGDSCGHRSTSKCVDSRTPTMAPSMIVQMNMKRAISSVQM